MPSRSFADLIKQGLSGNQLLENQNGAKKVRPAVEAMLTQAEQAAVGRVKATHTMMYLGRRANNGTIKNSASSGQVPEKAEG